MRRLKTCLLTVGVLGLAGFTACGDDNPVDDGDDTGEIGGVATKHTDPAALLAAHAEATSARNLEAYEALLVQPADDALLFEFYPKAGDANDLPWLEGDCWGYETEIDIMTNMFDPNYSSPDADPLQSIEMGMTVLAIAEPGDGTIVVDCTATILVLVGPDDGWFADTRFLFDLVSVGGYLRIQRIEEAPRQKAALAGMRAAGEESSWSQIKAIYRSSE